MNGCEEEFKRPAMLAGNVKLGTNVGLIVDCGNKLGMLALVSIVQLNRYSKSRFLGMEL